MHIRIVCCAFLIFTPSTGIAQVSAPTATTATLDQLNMTIDMLATIKSAVAQTRKGKELATYKTVSLRLAQCSIFYGLLAKQKSPPDVDTSLLFSVSANAYSAVAAMLHQGTVASFEQEAKKAIEEVNKLSAMGPPGKDNMKLLYLARNCRDLSKQN